MGIDYWTADHMLPRLKQRNIRGSVLSLARMDIRFGLNQFLGLLTNHGYYTRKGNEVFIPDGDVLYHILQTGKYQHAQNPNWLNDLTYFGGLGFESLVSVDITDEEGASYVFDLNKTGLGDVVRGQFDFVVDCGTIEHVFHTPNFLRNIFDTLKPGGYVYHMTPTNNYVDHGFFQFSPTFFSDYYTANGFIVEDMTLIRQQLPHRIETGEPWMEMRYRPGCLDTVSFGGLDEHPYAVAVLARKTAESTWDRIPVQRFYADKFKAAGSPG